VGRAARQVVQEAHEHRRRDAAAVRIQTLWRGYQARQDVAVLGLRVYEMCVDTTNKTVYFFNPRTGRAQWTKPKLLRSKDVRSPIEAPAPERDFSITCGMCRRCAARKWCLQCEDYFCAHDHATAHKKGKATQHQSFALDTCVQCNVQVASRLCNRCHDEYCDTCFFALHRRGQLRLHSYTPITPLCSCCKYMALRLCTTCNLPLCRVCSMQGHEVRADFARAIR
jgi:hypothetical protein